MTDEQKEEERRDQVVLAHCKAIESGQKPFTPLQSLNLPPKQKCPSCGDTMKWYPARSAYLCLKCQ